MHVTQSSTRVQVIPDQQRTADMAKAKQFLHERFYGSGVRRTDGEWLLVTCDGALLSLHPGPLARAPKRAGPALIFVKKHK